MASVAPQATVIPTETLEKLPGRRRRILAVRATGVFLTLVVLVSGGCTAQTRHEVLVIFFEGVPVPGASPRPTKTVVPADAAAPIAEPVRPTGSIHRPVHERKCGECHERSPGASGAGNGQNGVFSGRVAVLLKDPRELCVQCHPEVVSHPHLHAPVASRLCTSCHFPHASPHRKLLRKETVNNLCGSCHVKDDYTERSGHSLGTPGECGDCHDPHGGKDKYFLRKHPADGILEEGSEDSDGVTDR